MIRVICVGKVKERYMRDMIDDYLSRISRYTKIEVTVVDDCAYEEKALMVEGNGILKHIKEGDYVISLDIDGKMMDSLEFAGYLDGLFVSYSDVVFVIGGSYGLSDEVKKRSNYSLSFGKMTYPHQLFRGILLEQIYRAYKINNNERYHK